MIFNYSDYLCSWALFFLYFVGVKLNGNGYFISVGWVIAFAGAAGRKDDGCKLEIICRNILYNFISHI
jgi:hypothetical protein